MKFPPPLRFAIPLLLLLFGCSAGWLAFIFDQGQEARRIETQFIRSTELVGAKLAAMSAYFLETGAIEGGQREVALSGANPNITTIVVADAVDRVLFSNRAEWRGQLIATTDAQAHYNLIETARSRPAGITEIVAGGNRVVGAFPFAVPSGDGQRTAGLGVVVVVFDLTQAKSIARTADLHRAQIGILSLAVLCGVFTLVFHRMLTGRVRQLVDASEKLAAGDLTARAGFSGGDELALVARAFDSMAAQLLQRDHDLRESELRFHQMAETVEEIYWIYDFATARMVYANLAFERIFGVPLEDFMKDTSVWKNAVHPEDREWVLATFARERLEKKDIEYRIVRPGGTVRWLRDRSFPIHEPGESSPRRVVGIAEDITDRRAAAEAKASFDHKLQETQRLESLGVLAGGIAHDFNNLLTGILGNASLARATPRLDEAQQCLTDIEDTAIRAADLCKQMLAYSGKGRFHVQHLDLCTLVRDTTNLLRLSISKSATLNFNLARTLPTIEADPTQMRQVIMNLVINASEALDEKSGTISISTGLAHIDRSYFESAIADENLPAGDYAYLEIADNGCGMDTATQMRIFEPFYTTKFTGRGLGLSAVLGIVRGHKGAMKVYSEPGRGTTFKLLFPTTGAAAQPLDPDTPVEAEWKGSGTILVIDDESTVRVVAARMLAMLGFDAVIAADGIEGVERFHEAGGKFTAVLMDLTMPQMGGEEAFRRIRALDPHARVILMSGFNEQEAINRFTGKGLAGFLQKPFKAAELRDKLRLLLETPPIADAR